MPRVKYTDRTGLAYLVEVPAGTSKEHYGKGIVLGPPDLRDLELGRDQLKALHKGLVDADLIQVRDLQKIGALDKLHKLAVSIIGREQASDLVRKVLAIYQQEAYS
jgi:hypothetical protein